jgi:hypothetical protein
MGDLEVQGEIVPHEVPIPGMRPMIFIKEGLAQTIFAKPNDIVGDIFQCYARMHEVPIANLEFRKCGGKITRWHRSVQEEMLFSDTIIGRQHCTIDVFQLNNS